MSEEPQTYQEPPNVQRLEAFIIDALKHEERWRVVGNVACSIDLPFAFGRPETKKFMLYLQSKEDRIDICPNSGMRLRLRVNGTELPCFNYEFEERIARYAGPLYEKLATQHQREFNDRLAEQVLNQTLKPKSLATKMMEWFSEKT